ncbi:P-loop NTPase [Achromobacter insuavis]|uniref:nucleotide-binding protein n=1 Tax=Achromobacter insuavis TaxID=1287735 RepID=UPI001F14522B|nr:P-loop NTPase [Achromobacter insuavis]
MKKIFFVGGGKGGVGKSTVSIGLIDYLLSQGEKVLLVETDTSNPDVWKMHKDEIPCILIDLDDANGWIELVNACDEHSDSTVLVNTAARNNRGVAVYGETLNATLDELKRELITYWVINRQRDSLELLKEFMEALPAAKLHVVRNSYFGEERKFELYEGSNVKKLVEERGSSLTFPDLADRVSDDLFSKRLSVTAALDQLPIGNRAELLRWRKEAHRMFETVSHD